MVLLPKGRVTDEENVHDDTARPHVHGSVIRHASDHLGAQVPGRAGKACRWRSGERRWGWWVAQAGEEKREVEREREVECVCVCVSVSV